MKPRWNIAQADEVVQGTCVILCDGGKGIRYAGPIKTAPAEAFEGNLMFLNRVDFNRLREALHGKLN